MVSRCFPGGYNVKLYISRGRLAWWLLAFLCCVECQLCQKTNGAEPEAWSNTWAVPRDIYYLVSLGVGWGGVVVVMVQSVACSMIAMIYEYCRKHTIAITSCPQFASRFWKAVLFLAFTWAVLGLKIFLFIARHDKRIGQSKKLCLASPWPFSFNVMSLPVDQFG